MGTEQYEQAQLAIANLKAAIHGLLSDKNTPSKGLRNVDISRALGIRGGIGSSGKLEHLDWISKTVLCMMEREEVVECNNRYWKLGE